MSPSGFGPHGLLQYDATFGVLICRDCQYAIQKSAIESHLLKHKIYRDERQRLLKFIAKLNLKEPEQVVLPVPTSGPVVGLPVIPGFRCQISGCGNLCASQKRMKRHQSEEHSLNESAPFATLARPAKLQTFFRGTKLKYFEVADSIAQSPQVQTSTSEEQHEAMPPNLDTLVTEQFPQQESTVSAPLPRLPSVNINLAAMTYFHHFTTITSLTLPRTGTTMESSSYWQIDAVSYALGEHWLMCGLLSISAYHLAVLTENSATRRTHFEQSEIFSVEFFAAWVGLPEREHDGSDFEANQGLKEVSNRIRFILNLIEWTSIGTSAHQDNTGEILNSYQLRSFLSHLRDYATHDLTFVWHNDEEDQEDPFALAAKTLKLRPIDRFSSVLNHLGKLPSTLAEILGRSENVPDVLIILRSVAILVNSCAENFESDEAESSFRIMTAWLVKVPNRFHQMVADNEPAALIVTACWAAVLVKRAEQCGCWYLGNSGELVLSHITHRISDNYAMVALIEEMRNL